MVGVAVSYAVPNDFAVNEDLAELQYQNQFDQRLSVHCHGADGMYKVLSVHDNKREDRVWN